MADFRATVKGGAKCPKSLVLFFHFHKVSVNLTVFSHLTKDYFLIELNSS